MRRKIINIDTDENKKEVFEKFNSVNSKHQAHILFGISDNKSGSEYLKEIAQQVGFDLNVYKQRKEKPKRYCLQCGEEILSRHNQKFCCQSCATTYQNLHTVKTEETKKKISESLKQYNKENPRFCNEQTLKRKQRNKSDKNNKGSQKNVKIRKYCLQCGNEIISKNAVKFCSNKCHSEYVHKKAYEDYLNNNDKYCRGNYTPKQFYNEFLKEQNYTCACCPSKNEHNGLPLKFVIDHIDGDASNNKRENIRLVCPNCDSQLPTFKSKNKNSTRRNYWREHIFRKIKEENE